MVTVDPDEPVVKEETPVDEDVSFKIASQIEVMDHAACSPPCGMLTMNFSLFPPQSTVLLC